MVVYVNNDAPDFLDDNDGVKYKFIAQPTNKKINHTTIPLVMGDHIKWHHDENFIARCRQQKKIYDYCFMGQIYGNRQKLTELKLDNFLFKQTGSIYNLNLNNQQKQKTIEDFLISLAQCKFCFAPRGSGTSSFRLYESLMVGTVPIITDMVKYPFDGEVNWDKFTVRGNMNQIYELIKKSKDINYNQFRIAGISFWEKYTKIINLHNLLISKIRRENVSR